MTPEPRATGSTWLGRVSQTEGRFKNAEDSIFFTLANTSNANQTLMAIIILLPASQTGLGHLSYTNTHQRTLGPLHNGSESHVRFVWTISISRCNATRRAYIRVRSPLSLYVVDRNRTIHRTSSTPSDPQNRGGSDPVLVHSLGGTSSNDSTLGGVCVREPTSSAPPRRTISSPST